MEKVKLYEFENEQAFEDYLVSFGFVDWTYFQQEMSQPGCHSVGLFIDDEMVSAAKFFISKTQELNLVAMQTRDDVKKKGYGSTLVNFIIKSYCNDEVKVKWTDESLGFWIKEGFHFSENILFMVR